MGDDHPSEAPTRPGLTHAIGAAALVAGLVIAGSAPVPGRLLASLGAVLGCAESPRAVVPREGEAWVWVVHVAAVALSTAGVLVVWLGPGVVYRAAGVALIAASVVLSGKLEKEWAAPSLARRVRARMREEQAVTDAIQSETLALVKGGPTTPEARHAAYARATAATERSKSLATLGLAMLAVTLVAWMAVIAGLMVLWSAGSPWIAGALAIIGMAMLRPAEQLGRKVISP